MCMPHLSSKYVSVIIETEVVVVESAHVSINRVIA